MKKRYILFLFFVSIVMVFAFSDHIPKTTYHSLKIPNPAELRLIQEKAEKEETEQHSFVLPASLQVIEDEAFEGTALQSVELPESVVEIGDRAFANNDDMIIIRLPNSIQHIGDDVLAGSERAVMAVYAGSETLNQVLGKNYRHYVMVTFNEKQMNMPVALMTGAVSHTEDYEPEDDVCPVESNVRRTGRTVGELKGEKHRGIAALYIRSRYFP